MKKSKYSPGQIRAIKASPTGKLPRFLQRELSPSNGLPAMSNLVLKANKSKLKKKKI